MIEAGDIVKVQGEDDLWKVIMAGTASPIVQIIKNRNVATSRAMDRAKLILISEAANADDESPRLIPARGILD